MRAESRSDIRDSIRLWRRRLLWQQFLYSSAVVSVWVLITSFFPVAPALLMIVIIFLYLAGLGLLHSSTKWRRLTDDNFVQHLNRRFSNLEESAQLFLLDDTQLTNLQNLQRDRIDSSYRKNLANQNQWQPEMHITGPVFVIAICGLLSLFSSQIRISISELLKDISPPSAVVSLAADNARILTARVQITPPAYTRARTRQSNQLNLELLEGSEVEWNLSFEPRQELYALRLADDSLLEFVADDSGQMTAHTIINTTTLYRLVKLDNSTETPLGDIYSLTVTLDQVPDIRILEPGISVLEIGKNEPPRFNSEVLINDDHGLNSAGILASVAKGSGEAVKFRDLELTFDHSTVTDKGTLYSRDWDLQSLAMEPGDEVYFTVIATDNKLPEANTGRSDTLIVRWLDDERASLSADGMAIDFIPEFFKSQRQIIIDTEQLIEDHNRLSAEEFKNTSYSIGRSQARLKQKYGQYLGDEFGEVPGEQFGVMPEIAENSETGDHHDEQEHDMVSASETNKNIRTTADILRLYGHDHGDPEIGPITKRNPVALMKRAVGEMWQAEKHLMQAEPKLALSFEYEAYKYLKLARQADRIYVKRLGFVAPPVSEERRLSGELDEILDYRNDMTSQSLDPDGNAWEQALLRDTYQLLISINMVFSFSEDEIEKLRELSSILTKKSQKTPALIQQAATIEKLLVAGDSSLEGCDKCIQELRSSLWNLIEDTGSELSFRRAKWHPDDSLIKTYQAVLKDAENPETVGLSTNGGEQ